VNEIRVFAGYIEFIVVYPHVFHRFLIKLFTAVRLSLAESECFFNYFFTYIW